MKSVFLMHEYSTFKLSKYQWINKKFILKIALIKLINEIENDNLTCDINMSLKGNI